VSASIACWISWAQSTAATTLANSTSAPSPISFTMRPPWRATQGSKRLARFALSFCSVPDSSRSMSAL